MSHGDFACLYTLSSVIELLHGVFPLIMAISNEKIIRSELQIIIKGTPNHFKGFGPINVFKWFLK